MLVRALALAASLCLLAPAHADTFSFTAPMPYGPDTGTVTGTINLPFIVAGDSGTGAATSFTLTSVPSGLSALAGGNTVTSWTKQLDNSFTVVNGVVTSTLFWAEDGPETYFCVNTTGSNQAGTPYGCNANFDELQTNSFNAYGFNYGTGIVTFKDVGPSPSPTPEPSSLALLATGIVAAAGVGRRRWLPHVNRG